MKGAPSIAVDIEAGEVRLGSERVRLLPVTADGSLPLRAWAASLVFRVPADVFYLNDARGPIVRASRFEERSLLLADVPSEDVVTRIADAALVSPGQCPDVIRVAASLALAGGGEDAPSFSDCAAFAEQQDGWDSQRVGETMALLIDRLCGDMAPADSNNGWEQITFQEREPDVETLISQMVTNLAERSGSRRVDLESETLATPEESGNKNERSPSERSFSARNDNDPLELATKPRSVSPVAASVPNDTVPLELTTRPRSVTPVSSGLPVDTVDYSTAASTARRASSDSSLRVSARVIALDTDRLMRTDPVVLPASPSPNPKAENPVITFSKLGHAQATTIPAALPLTNHAGFSLIQAAAPSTDQPPLTIPSAATSPTWQPFEPSSQNPQTPLAASPTPAGADSPLFSAWLSELADLLEAECDMRGIDP